jgi:WD40 repeat protein
MFCNRCKRKFGLRQLKNEEPKVNRFLFSVIFVLGAIEGLQSQQTVPSVRLHWQQACGVHLPQYAISSDSHWIVVGCSSSIRIWDFETGREVRRFPSQGLLREMIKTVAFTKDGRGVLSGSFEGKIHLWDVESGKIIQEFGPQESKNKNDADEVQAIAASPDGNWIIAGIGKTARLYDRKTGREARRFEGHSSYVNSADFSPDGRLVITASSDGTARVWDFASGRELHRFGVDGEDGLDSVMLSTNGLRILTHTYSGDARLWDVRSGREIRRFAGRKCIALSADGQRVLAGGPDDRIHLLDAATGRELRVFEVHFRYEPHWVAFLADDKRIMAGDQVGTYRIWDEATYQEVGAHDEPELGSSSPSNRFVSPDARFVLSATSNAFFLADFSEKSLSSSGTVLSAVFSEDSRWAAISPSPTAVWDLTTGKIRHLPASAAFYRAAFSPDDKLLATTGAHDKVVHLWEIETAREIMQLVGHSESVFSLAFSPDGRFIVTGSADETVRVWDATTGKQVRSIHTSSAVDELAVSPNGKLVATSGRGVPRNAWEALTGASPHGWVTLWELSTGKELFKLTGHEGSIQSIRFSPDGHSVLTGSEDLTARLWDLQSGKEIRRFGGHTGWITSVAFTPDGHTIVTSGSLLKFWDVGTGREWATMDLLMDGGWVIVDPEGRYDASEPGNVPGLHFVVGDDVIELNQLKQRFYTPGLLTRILRGEELSKIDGSLRDVELVPALEVRPPAPGSTTAVAQLTNRGGGIGKVIVRVNGRELIGVTRGQSIDANSKSAQLTLDLSGATLAADGKNVIEVFAENRSGLIRSRGFVVPWEKKPATESAVNLYAVVVGISDYDNSAMNLRYSAKDANDFSHALELAGNRLFGQEHTHITVLASGSAIEPTKQNIRDAFEDIGKRSRSNDVLVVYFAGHGAAARTEGDHYFYFTKEARSADVDRDAGMRATSTISSTELRDWLERQNMPLKQVLILDTCAAGAAFGDMVKLADRRELSPDQVRAIELLKDSTGSWILMGSAADAVSYEANRYAQGLLTYGLLQGMKGAALDGDQVEVSRLFGFAQRQVEDLARGIGGLQRPILSAPKGQTFPIGLLTIEDRKQIHLATAKAELLRARVLDENDLDALNLEPALRTELRTASLPVTRGNEPREPKIVYLDSVVDEVPDALIPQVRYVVANNRVKARLRLLQNGKPIAERNIEIESKEASVLSKELVTNIIAASGNLP